jgi:hypothetical protein
MDQGHNPNELCFKLEPDGVHVFYGSKELIFKSSFEIDPIKLAEQLQMESAGEALKLKTRIRQAEAKAPITLDHLIEVLGTTVKKDDVNKVITFLCMLSAYTEESQFNVSFRAPSSTGKSYLPIELSQYFPFEDVVKIAYSSPTAFYHDTGEWDREAKIMRVNLEKKILIFLDQPHDQLLQRLRPLLSHDQKELLYKITDKREKAGLRTKNVIIRGFPSTIFCTGSLKIDEQEQTRNFLLSPETTQEKIREGIYLKALRKADPIAYEELLKQHPEREILKERIRAIKNAGVKYVVVKDYNRIVEKFLGAHRKLKPRHQRDIERIISIVQAFALLNLFHRKKDERDNVYASDEDVENAFRLFDQISESQELGIPPYIFNFYNEVVKPAYQEINKNTREDNTPLGLSRQDILKKHFEVYGRIIPDWQLRREIIPSLEEAGLIYQETDPNDKRKTLIHCTTPPSSSLYLPLADHT